MKSFKLISLILCFICIPVCLQAYNIPSVDTPVVSGTTVVQTLTPAGYDKGKTGDIYIFTPDQYWDGSSWTTSVTPYMNADPVGVASLSYDVAGLPDGTVVYAGFGFGYTNTFATLQKSGSFVSAYTTGLGSSTIWYKDADMDGFGDPNSKTVSADQPAGYVSENSDCDDSDPAVNPGAIEIDADGTDQDCDGEGYKKATVPYTDATAVNGTIVTQEFTPAGNDAGKIADVYILTKNQYWDGSTWTTVEAPYLTGATLVSFPMSYDVGGLPDNTDIYVGYGAGLSNTVAAMNENGTLVSVYTTGPGSSNTWYEDADMDGFGNPGSTVDSADQPAGYVSDNTDCDDLNPNIHPGAVEIAGDGTDQDCDGNEYKGTSPTVPSIYTPVVNGTIVVQEFKAALNDIGKAGDIYIFTQNRFWDGISWTTTETSYQSGNTLGMLSVSYDMSGLPDGTDIYVGYGTGLSNTFSTLYNNAVFVPAYTTGGQSEPADQISTLSPSNNETMGYGASSGKITFSFSKVTGAAKYILHLNLYDILNSMTIPVPIELIPPGASSGSAWGGGATTGTPGFSEQVIGMVFELPLDSATWNVLALYEIQWGVEAYDDNGTLIGSTYDGATVSKYVNGLKLTGSNAISMTSPTNGSSLTQTDAAPTFQWEPYQGAGVYKIILAHVGALGFDYVVVEENLALNLFPMDEPTWQTMPAGTWYWTVLGYNGSGVQTPEDFTLFDFEVQ